MSTCNTTRNPSYDICRKSESPVTGGLVRSEIRVDCSEGEKAQLYIHT